MHLQAEISTQSGQTPWLNPTPRATTFCSTARHERALERGAVSKLRRRGEYGLDGGMIGVLGMAAVTVVLLAAAPALVLAGFVRAAAITALVAALLLTTLGFGLHTTRRGKFLVWSQILDSLPLRGDERVLDVGCGRGAVLTMVAERLPRGRVVGIDIWSVADQSGNGPDAARRNLETEGVQER